MDGGMVGGGGPEYSVKRDPIWPCCDMTSWCFMVHSAVIVLTQSAS